MRNCHILHCSTRRKALDSVPSPISRISVVPWGLVDHLSGQWSGFPWDLYPSVFSEILPVLPSVLVARRTRVRSPPITRTGLKWKRMGLPMRRPTSRIVASHVLRFLRFPVNAIARLRLAARAGRSPRDWSTSPWTGLPHSRERMNYGEKSLILCKITDKNSAGFCISIMYTYISFTRAPINVSVNIVNI